MDETFRVTRTPVHEQVRDHLRQLAQRGTLAPGDTLPPERQLAQRLGVSRHSLRQALASLESLGIVEVRHGSGVYLTRWPSDEAVTRVADALFSEATTMVDAIEARLAFEPYIARLGAQRRSDADIEALQKTMQVRSEVSSGADWASGEALSFHRQLARMTGNPIFEGLLRSVTTGPRNIATLAEQEPDSRDQWHTDHLAIYQAVETGDAPGAAQLMTNHLDQIIVLARLMDATRTDHTNIWSQR